MTSQIQHQPILLRVEGCSPQEVFPFAVPRGCQLHYVKGGALLAFSRQDKLSVLVSAAKIEGHNWIHASCSFQDRMPSYADLVWLKDTVFGDSRSAYMVLPKRESHVNIHPYCLHLYGRLDGTDALPDFTMGQGTI